MIQPEECPLHLQDLSPALLLVEGGVLQRGADAQTDLRRLVDDIEPEHPGGSPGRLQQGGEHLDDRGLPCTIRAQEAVDLTCLNGQIHTTDGLDVAEAPPQTCCLDHGSVVHPSNLRLP